MRWSIYFVPCTDGLSVQKCHSVRISNVFVVALQLVSDKIGDDITTTQARDGVGRGSSGPGGRSRIAARTQPLAAEAEGVGTTMAGSLVNRRRPF